ncbi:NAD(P)H nitroreductase [Williamsia sp. CHRR-6]|uniref:Acg family FMN-binding oxidoreductase n=1 Tax=Williamsia sp. CHRR-6 TaxID=2835871 RepID=UPI001BD9E359|nr:NAD(P)H nitroreductase [Williamsia sp. CHRR-6]MBT0567180.1 NAD(P)H nitroreductase [Williamsia sp. CHRR-6]
MTEASEIDALDLPTHEVIIEAVRVAGLAPSLHNSQPWRWVRSNAALHLFGVPQRRLACADPTGREYRISLGVALDHLRMALDAAGWSAAITVLPDPSQPDHIARVQMARRQVVSPSADRRVRAITERFSHRLPMDAPVDFDEFTAALSELTDTGPVAFSQVQVSHLAAVAEASRLNDLERSSDWRYHSELSWWTGTTVSSVEGVPATSLLTDNEYDALLVGRSFPRVIRAGAPATEDDAAQILVLDTTGDEPADHIACGVALSAILVEAQMRGLATCVVSDVTELPASRAMLCAAGGDPHRVGRFPQVLVRVGTARGEVVLPRSNRRPVDDIYDEDLDMQLGQLFAAPVPLWPLLRGV